MVGDATICKNYLKSLGKEECRATRSGSVFCVSGKTVVKGFAVGPTATGSWCEHVAAAVGWVLDNCSTCRENDCPVSGMRRKILFEMLFVLFSNQKEEQEV